MDDLISRQAAIIQLSHNKNGDDDHDVIVQKDIETIKQLPSAEPEIIRCKDCKFARMTYDGECKYCDVWFPDEKTYMDGDYFCASAERRTDE